MDRSLPVSRRQLLAGGVAALLSAGVYLETRPPTTRLDDVVVVNRDDEPHAVGVEIRRGGETVYRGTHDLAASGTGDGGDASQAIPTQWPSSPATYEIRVGDPDVPGARSRVLPGDPPRQDVFVGYDGDGDPTVSVWADLVEDDP